MRCVGGCVPKITSLTYAHDYQLSKDILGYKYKKKLNGTHANIITYDLLNYCVCVLK